MTWGVWVEEYWPSSPELQRFWLRDATGAELAYQTEAAATEACREWFGQVPEHMTVREYPR